jgi:hypothetical protein
MQQTGPRNTAAPATPMRKSLALAFIVGVIFTVLCEGGVWMLYAHFQPAKVAESPDNSTAASGSNRSAAVVAPKGETLLGQWILKNEQRQFDVTFVKAGQNEYRLSPRNLSYSGTYRFDAGQLNMVRSESATRGLAWHWLDADHLVLINTQYRGSTLTRVGAKPYVIPPAGSAKSPPQPATRPATAPTATGSTVVEAHAALKSAVTVAQIGSKRE